LTWIRLNGADQARFLGHNARAMLGVIRAVTTVVPDLDEVESAYARWLGYTTLDRGHVPPDVAAGWQAPAMSGRAYLTMGPASGEAVFLRFVAGAMPASYRALTTHGWNATEILAEDPDALAARLDGSPFRIIGAPKSLTRFPMIRAMQVLGPAGECLYFTRVGAGSGLDLAQARGFVDRVFIVVAGGSPLSGLLDWYGAFGNPVDPPVATPVSVISWANGLPLDSLHEHALIALGQGTHVEPDQYPGTCGRRPCAADELPPGMAMVSFAWRGSLPPPTGVAAAALLPGLRQVPATTLLGPAGERLEILSS
jgi:hypothetical protein